VLPASTVAVSVTTAPELTDVTALPPEVTASVVVVAVLANPGQLAATIHAQASTSAKRALKSNRFKIEGSFRRTMAEAGKRGE